MRISTLIISLFIATCARAQTNYYSIAGGNWSTTSHSGADCSCSPPTGPAAGDTIFVDRNTCDGTSGYPFDCSARATTLNTSGCHSMSVAGNWRGVLEIETGAFMFIDGTSTATATTRWNIRGELWLNGTLSGVPATTVRLVNTINPGKVWQFGAFALYYEWGGTGAFECCGGGLSITNNPPLNLHGNFFGQTSGTFACPGVVLDVDLASFEVDHNKVYETTNLQWSTISETNNKGFHVMRSEDGYSWDELGFIYGEGTSNSQLSYSYEDQDPVPGVSYYKLIQEDFDGTMVAHEIRRSITDNEDFYMWPNVVADGKINVRFPKSTKSAKIELVDRAGKVRFDQQVHLDNSQEVELSISEHLSPGIYFAKLTSGKKATIRKLAITPEP